jgi:hypothetical protein
VTLGADVAITSVIIKYLRDVLGIGEIVLAGSEKIEQLMGGNQALRFKHVGYNRTEGLRERLRSWLDLVKALTEPDRVERSLIVDPDSRLTQLGLLPPCTNNPARQYLFFPSREFRSDTSDSLGSLTGQWLNLVFGTEQRILPEIWLKPDARNRGDSIMNALRRSSPRPLVTFNIGVGENPAKGLGADFEAEILNGLLRAGATVILDRGFGTEESNRVSELVKRAEKGSKSPSVVEFDEDGIIRLLETDTLIADLLVWKGRIGLFSELIAKSDLYLGYDSACQHIAAALGVPSIDLIAGYGSRRFLERWTPTGPGEVRVIDAGGSSNTDVLIAQVLENTQALLKNVKIR